MSSKSEVIELIDSSKTYIGSKCKEFVGMVHCEERLHPPKKWKKGDVIRVRVNMSNEKTRPSVVIKVCKEYLISIPLTSSEDVNTLCESVGSRFFKDSYFCNNYVLTPISYSDENFLGIYDNNKSLNLAIKKLKDFINQNI